jgi:hypothetical protein
MNGYGIAAIAVCGLAGMASAQGTMTMTWSGGDTGNNNGVVEPGESAVMTMWASMDPTPAVGFAGAIYDIGGDADWGAGTIVDYVNLVDTLATGPGTLGGGNAITGIESFQLPPFFNAEYDASNPIALYSIIWTPADYVAKFVSFGSTNHVNFDVYTDDFGTSESYDGEVFSGLIKVIPAPASIALFGFGGLAAIRRRR